MYNPDTISVLPSAPCEDFDVVLKSALDGQQFLAHRAILRLASTAPSVIFANLEIPRAPAPTRPARALGPISPPWSPQTPRFDLSTNIVPTAKRRKVDGSTASTAHKFFDYAHKNLPVYLIDAEGAAITSLLRLLYPIVSTPSCFRAPTSLIHPYGPGLGPHGTLPKLAEALMHIGLVMGLAQKLYMVGVIADLCLATLDIANSPSLEADASHKLALKVYLTASRFHLLDIAQTAAHACLRGGEYAAKQGGDNAAMEGEDDLCVDVYRALLDYRSRAVAAVLSLFRVPTGESLFITNGHAQSTALEKTVEGYINCEDCCSSFPPTATHTAAWWDYFTMTAVNHLRDSPRGEPLYWYKNIHQVEQIARECPACSVTFLARWVYVQRVLRREISSALASVSFQKNYPLVKSSILIGLQVRLDLSCLYR